MRFGVVVSVALAAACWAACGGDGGAPIDAGDPDMSVDTPPAYPACREFAGTATAVPAHVTGTLAAADVQSPSECGKVDAPYGIESAGPDNVVELSGLMPGTAYIVQLNSSSDLAFYVASGCSTPSGPAAGECALFVDATTGSQEVGRFVATSTTAWVVVDYWASSPPANQTFMLDVYAEACTSDAQCTAGLPVCLHGKCVQCETSFDCTAAAKPRCDTESTTCVAGTDSCASDDATEPANDGPAGAVPIVVDGGGAATIVAQVCSQPRTEADFYSFTVTTVGETWDFTLEWNGNRDLDLRISAADGERVAMSFWEQPEHARLTYLPLGTYYVHVADFSAQSSNATDYTLRAQRTTGAGCSSSADCAAEYRNQTFRGSCQAGACVAIAGAGAVVEGGACDSVSDCGSGLTCPSFYFVANADTRDVCARTCTNDNACAALGANYVCTTYLVTNQCVQKCTADDQCPTDIERRPSAGPWERLTCDLQSGRCLP